MLPEDVENYLSQVARVLKRGGRCVISFFLLNGVSQAPEAAIGYEEAFVLSRYDKYNLEIENPIRYGSWVWERGFFELSRLDSGFQTG